MVKEAVVEEAEVEETEALAQPTIEELTQKLESTNTELEKAKTDLETVREESSQHQRNVSKKADELKKQEDATVKIKTIEKNMGVLTDMMSDLINRGDDDYEAPKRRRSDQYTDRLKQEERTQEPTQTNPKALEAMGLANSVGLRIETSPELTSAYIKFLEGDYDGGLSEVRKVVDKTGADKGKETEDAMKERLEGEFLKKHGLDKNDNTPPSGGGLGIPTKMTQFREWINDIPQEEYEEKYAAKVNEMMRQNKIK